MSVLANKGFPDNDSGSHFAKLEASRIKSRETENDECDSAMKSKNEKRDDDDDDDDDDNDDDDDDDDNRDGDDDDDDDDDGGGDDDDDEGDDDDDSGDGDAYSCERSMFTMCPIKRG